MASNFENWNTALIDLLISVKDNYANWYLLQSTSHDRLNEILTEIAIPLTERLELMVKHFTILEKSPVRLLDHSAEKSHPNPVAPFMNANKSNDNL